MVPERGDDRVRSFAIQHSARGWPLRTAGKKARQAQIHFARQRKTPSAPYGSGDQDSSTRRGVQISFDKTSFSSIEFSHLARCRVPS
jgi:hypothetical protein